METPNVKHNPETGCWEWKGSKTTFGYPTFWLHEKGYKAHIVVYILFHGHHHKGKPIYRKCGNIACINPMHMTTHPENPNQ